MTIAARELIVVGIVAFTGTANTTTAQALFGPLTAGEIEEAIDLGIERDPEPYEDLRRTGSRTVCCYRAALPGCRRWSLRAGRLHRRRWDQL